MNRQTTPSAPLNSLEIAQACTAKSFAFITFNQALRALTHHADSSQAKVNLAKVEYLKLVIPGNANPYVPWDNLGLEFQCPTCDQGVTADQEHPLHPEDEALLKAAEAAQN